MLRGKFTNERCSEISSRILFSTVFLFGLWIPIRLLNHERIKVLKFCLVFFSFVIELFSLRCTFLLLDFLVIDVSINLKRKERKYKLFFKIILLMLIKINKMED